MGKEEIRTIKANKFKVSTKKWESVYRFPFKVLDDTPGGSNLGRIEWCIEPFKGKKHHGRYYIEKLWVWAKQTRDKRYAKKIFEIPCFSEAISGDSLKQKDSFLHNVWLTFFCGEHRNSMQFWAYPENGKSILEIDVSSSISINIEFL